MPVIVVVPETNLVDWHEDEAWLVPALKGDGNSRWRILATEAQAAFDARDTLAAARLATQLTALDEFTSPVGPSMLARCHLHSGATAKAREQFELARDTCRTLPLRLPPGCARTIQEGLRASAARHGFHIIDLPQLMGDHLDGELPDRRLFLDYCHLTSEGVRLLVQSVANATVELLGLGEALDLWQVADVPATTREADADAHFMAAIHCARWHQPGDLVLFHCNEAARLCPTTIERMASYLDAFGQPGPPWLRRRFSHLIGERHSPTYRYFCEVSPIANENLQDEVLIDELNRIARELEPARVWSHSHTACPSAYEIDLLSSRHLAVNDVNSVVLALRPPAYIEAYEPASRFVVRLALAGAFRLQITYRTPFAAPDGMISIEVNGVEASAFPACAKWASVQLPDLALSGGRNELTISWPPIATSGESFLQRSRTLLKRGEIPNPLVEYGHCYRLCLTPEP